MGALPGGGPLGGGAVRGARCGGFGFPLGGPGGGGLGFGGGGAPVFFGGMGGVGRGCAGPETDGGGGRTEGGGGFGGPSDIDGLLSGESFSALSCGEPSFFGRFPSGGEIGFSDDSRFFVGDAERAGGKFECCGDFLAGEAKIASPSPSTEGKLS